MPIMRRSFFSLIALVVLGGVALSGCATSHAATPGHDIGMAPLSDMPAEVQQSPPPVRESYQFAAANAEFLRKIPCYCGCGVMGHASNYDCYVAEVDADGAITYDLHAVTCSICVDITQDTIRLLKQGQSVSKIRAYIDSAYVQFGPSNMP
jgi:hypothetical protein